MELVRQTISDAREITTNLRPTVLDDFGLVAAVSREVQRLREVGYVIDYEEGLDERLPPMTEITLFRVAQEALANARTHAQTRRMHSRLELQGDEVRLEVRDEGCGFDLEGPSAASGPGERFGIPEMRERVALLGGELRIDSKPGAGTALVASVLLPSHKGSL